MEDTEESMYEVRIVLAGDFPRIHKNEGLELKQISVKCKVCRYICIYDVPSPNTGPTLSDYMRTYVCAMCEYGRVCTVEKGGVYQLSAVKYT